VSENIIIAIVGAAGAIVGGILTAVVTAHNSRRENDVKSSELLLDAQRQLKQTMEDNEQLWLWNRQLVDHIWRRAPPPPPNQPAGLFHHYDNH
jgi:hypothetical protein